MKSYKAEFEMSRVTFYIEFFGDYKDVFDSAKTLAKKLNVEFTGMLEEV